MVSSATNYKAFDYREYLKTKYIYGSVNLEDGLKVSEKTYLNLLLIFSNNLKNKIESNLEEILGENANIAKRYTTSEIHQIFQKKLQKTLKQVAYIIF